MDKDYLLNAKMSRPNFIALTVCIVGLSASAILYGELRAFVPYPAMIHGHVPTFLHVIIFSFLTAYVAGYSKKLRWLIPTFWVIINVLVEALQLSSVRLLRGTFDWFDLLAAGIGGLAAFASLPLVRQRDFQRAAFISTALFGLSILTGTSTSKNPLKAAYDPIYLSYAQLRADFAPEEARSLKKIGKILSYESKVLINERGSGIHVIDNQDPSHPKITRFIKIPGNLDMAIRNNILYADSFVDLLAIDVSNINDIKLVKRLENVLPYDPYHVIDDPNVYFLDEQLSDANGVVISAKPRSTP